MIKHLMRLANQIVVYGLGDTINKIAGIIITPIFTHYLTPTDYGAIALLTVSSALISGFADLGMSSGIVRFFGEENPKKKAILISTAQIVMLAGTTLVAILIAIFSKQVSILLFRTPAYANITAINFLTIPFTIAMVAPLIRLRMEEKAKFYSIFNVARIVTGLLLNVVFIVFLKRGVVGIFESGLISAALFGLMMLIFSVRKNGFSFHFGLFRKMLFFGSPFILSMISFWILDWADRFILGRLTNLSEVGLYNLGYSMGMAILLPVGAFATAWTPFFLSVAKEKNTKEIFSLSLTYYSLIIAFITLILAIFSRDYFNFFTAPSFHTAYIVAPVIALAYALKGNFQIMSSGSFLIKKPILEFSSELIAMILNVTLMFILIPHLGRMGAAWATLLAYATLPLTIFIFTQKYYPMRYDYKRIAKIVIVSLGIYFLAQLIYQPSVLNLFYRILILFSYPIILYLIGFFTEVELQKIKSFRLSKLRTNA